MREYIDMGDGETEESNQTEDIDGIKDTLKNAASKVKNVFTDAAKTAASGTKKTALEAVKKSANALVPGAVTEKQLNEAIAKSVVASLVLGYFIFGRKRAV